MPLLSEISHAKQPGYRKARLVLFCAAMILAYPCHGERISFDASTYHAARRLWQPGPQAPAPRIVDGGGIIFPCPFNQPGLQRVYWDQAVTLDLSGSDRFQIDISCPDPEAIRTLSLYFRSGYGWYQAPLQLHRSGRQTLSFSKDDFRTEGSPAGWDRIDMVRISPWRGAARETTLTVHQLREVRGGALVLRASRPELPPFTRRLADQLSRLMASWLSSWGVPHAVVSDHPLRADMLAGYAVVILPFNQQLCDDQLKTLSGYMASGGKLIVFYGDEPRLARLMGFDMDRYIAATPGAPWTGIQLEQRSGLPLPAFVYQNSGNLIRVTARERHSRVIGWWLDEKGDRTNIPALLQSPAGFWITHVFRGTGHLQAKEQLLAGLIASIDPTLGRPIAQSFMTRSGTIAYRRDARETLSLLSRSVTAGSERRAVQAALDAADTAYGNAREHFAAQRYGDVLREIWQRQAHLEQAYALLQRPQPNEFRAVWDHRGTGFYPGGWDQTARELSDAGFNAVFANMLNGSTAHYRSRVLRPSATFRNHGDQLTPFIRAARKHGLEAHVWKVCWGTEGLSEAEIQQLTREERLQVSARGETLPWLNPAHPANRQQAIASLVEIARNYEIDGLHLDYIRYPDAQACFSAYTRRAFENSRGRPVRNWPADALPGGPVSGEYNRWRQQQITTFVAEAGAAVRKARPGITWSAAVYGKYPDCAHSVAQDWLLWLREGIIDMVCPMNYTGDLHEFRGWTEEQMKFPGMRGKIHPGIGVASNQSSLTSDQVIAQIRETRRLGTGGFVLFDLNQELRKVILPALKMGITRTR